jgi:microcystin-dependent protein
MSEPFLGEIKIVSWSFAAKGWALANGQTVAINQNQALFSILGTTFGGNGTTNFLLPNLQGRTPMHVGQGAGLSVRNLGNYGGVEGITQQGTQIPQSPVSPKTSYIGSRSNLATISPFIVLNFIIALQGIFPSQS